MSWFNSFTGSDSTSWLNSDVGKLITNAGGQFLQTTLERNGIVKPGPQPTGNLSQAQIQAGVQVGSPTIQNNNPNAGGLMNSLGFGNGGSSSNIMMIAVIAIIGLVLFLVIKK